MAFKLVTSAIWTIQKKSGESNGVSVARCFAEQIMRFLLHDQRYEVIVADILEDAAQLHARVAHTADKVVVPIQWQMELDFWSGTCMPKKGYIETKGAFPKKRFIIKFVEREGKAYLYEIQNSKEEPLFTFWLQMPE